MLKLMSNRADLKEYRRYEQCCFHPDMAIVSQLTSKVARENAWTQPMMRANIHAPNVLSLNRAAKTQVYVTPHSKKHKEGSYQRQKETFQAIRDVYTEVTCRNILARYKIDTAALPTSAGEELLEGRDWTGLSQCIKHYSLRALRYQVRDCDMQVSSSYRGKGYVNRCLMGFRGIYRQLPLD